MTTEKLVDRFATIGFLLSGIYNVLGILVFSKLFTNYMLSVVDPVVFSWFGQVSLLLWGLAYWSVAQSYQNVLYLLVVFFFEKMLYTGTWLVWILEKSSSLPTIASESPLTAIFFSGYGVGDFVFGIFFGWVALENLKRNLDGNKFKLSVKGDSDT
ncbi:MAG: hypothetical protein ABEI32_01915 [Halothece sp.]